MLEIKRRHYLLFLALFAGHVLALAMAMHIVLLLFQHPEWGPISVSYCVFEKLFYKPPPPCPSSVEMVDATGVVYGLCEYDGPLEVVQTTCHTDMYDIRATLPQGKKACVASDGKYAVFLAELTYGRCSVRPCDVLWESWKTGAVPACSAVAYLGYYLLFVDLETGEALAAPLYTVSEDGVISPAWGVAAGDVLGQYVVLGRGGVYMRGVVTDRGVRIGNTSLVMSTGFVTLRVKIDRAKLRPSQPVGPFGGTLIKIPAPSRG